MFFTKKLIQMTKSGIMRCTLTPCAIQESKTKRVSCVKLSSHQAQYFQVKDELANAT